MKLQRRSLLKLGGALATGSVSVPVLAKLVNPLGSVGKDIHMNHLHTAERIGLVFSVQDEYLTSALDKLDHFLRDHYSGDVGNMDPLLYEMMYQIRRDLGVRRPFEVISGYRSPKTNEHLRTSRGGGVAKRSLHMDGKAIDVRLPGVPLIELREAAIHQKIGGVGYYPKDGFVHIDTGRVRSWGG